MLLFLHCGQPVGGGSVPGFIGLTKCRHGEPKISVSHFKSWSLFFQRIVLVSFVKSNTVQIGCELWTFFEFMKVVWKYCESLKGKRGIGPVFSGELYFNPLLPHIYWMLFLLSDKLLQDRKYRSFWTVCSCFCQAVCQSTVAQSLSRFPPTFIRKVWERVRILPWKLPRNWKFFLSWIWEGESWLRWRIWRRGMLKRRFPLKQIQ